jgi:DNA-binding NarL/FixJ family response regulator
VKPKKILIAEDHSLIRVGLRPMLETRDDLVIAAECASGREALEAARDANPDVAILDYSLPELNGIDLTIELRKMLPDLAVLIYTMHEREDLLIDAVQAGARAIVLKSDTERHLLAAIDSLASGRPHFSGIFCEMMLMQLLDEQLPPEPTALSHREREVVQLVAEGRLNKQIAHILDISVKTIESHRASAMQKLDLKSTADLVRYAIRNNMVG